LGELYAVLRRLDDAEIRFRGALEIDPQNTVAREGIAAARAAASDTGPSIGNSLYAMRNFFCGSCGIFRSRISISRAS